MVLVFVGVVVVRFALELGLPARHHSHPPATHPARPPVTPPRGRNPGSGRPTPLGIPGDWKLILDSEFDKGRLNTAIWRPGWFGDGVTGPINRYELACYSPSNVSVSAGRGVLLKVTRAASECDGTRKPYTGAVLSTNPDDGRTHGGFVYRYGVLQAKVFLPATAGSTIANWPTLVTLGQNWPRDGEDDIVENLAGLVCAHFHSIGYAPGGNLGGCDRAFSPGWCIVSADWRPGSVAWYYNGIEIAHASRGITSQPMYIVLVNTVSSKAPQLARAAAMGVAYVRVWQGVRPAGRTH